MTPWRAVALMMFLPFGAAAPAAAQAPEQPAWMAGCWVRESGARRIDEQWMAPRAGIMLGVSRTVRGDTLVEYEHLTIERRGGTLVYRASPSGQPPAEFTATSVQAGEVVFENPAHDFPQRIIYRARGTDSLVARIEGPVEGGMRSAEFPYRRGACR